MISAKALLELWRSADAADQDVVVTVQAETGAVYRAFVIDISRRPFTLPAGGRVVELPDGYLIVRGEFRAREHQISVRWITHVDLAARKESWLK